MPEADAVADVEGVFGASRRYTPDPVRLGSARFALWLCCCYDDDAPTWLIHDASGDLNVCWCRVPPGLEPLDLVHADEGIGDHTSAAQVPSWLHGSAAAPWFSPVGGADVIVVNALRDAILAP